MIKGSKTKADQAGKPASRAAYKKVRRVGDGVQRRTTSRTPASETPTADAPSPSLPSRERIAKVLR